MSDSANNDKHSMTSSDLGSSCDVNDDASSYDAQSRTRSEDGSTSLTLDSLEEEEESFKTDQLDLEEEATTSSPGTVKTPTADELRASDSREGFYLHQQQGAGGGGNTESSDPSGHSQTPGKSGDLSSGQSECDDSKCAAGGSGRKGSKHGDDEHATSAKCEQANGHGEVTRAGKTGGLDSATQNDEGKAPAVRSDSSADCGHLSADSGGREKGRSEDGQSMEGGGDPRPTSRAADSTPAPPDCLILRKCHSLREESSTDPRPKAAVRRSAIPRRRLSDQMLVTGPAVHSAHSSPHGSPRGLRRSLTLNTASLQGRPSPGSAASSPGSVSPASFPQTPVRAPKVGRSRSASACQSDCLTAATLACLSASLTKENVSSRLRFEKHHESHCCQHAHPAPDPSGLYRTPSQRKDDVIKELRERVKALTRQLEDREEQLVDTRRSLHAEADQIRSRLQREVDEARAAREAAQREVTSLKESHAQSVKTVATLQQRLEDDKKEMNEKLVQSEQIFLEMYNKGRESAIFEREEELELKAKGGRTPEATEKELHDKLVRTQAELAKWQTIQRHESYHTMLMPRTEAESTLRFLKDSIYHFLVNDAKGSDEHLRAIVKILRFSEMQRERIAYAIIHRRNKSGW